MIVDREITPEKELETHLAYLRRETKANFYVCCKSLLNLEVAPCHRKIGDHIQAHNHTLTIGPRLHGKSTIHSFAYPIYRLLNNHDIRILIASHAAWAARKLLWPIRLTLQAGPLFRAVHGDWIGEPWTKYEITVSKRKNINLGEPTISAYGIDGPIVGNHYELIVLDDIVTDKNCRTEHQRKELRFWFENVLLPTLMPGGELHIVGTHYDSADMHVELLEIAKSVEYHNAEAA